MIPNQKTFCIAKETIRKMKRQAKEWEKNIANHVSVYRAHTTQ